MQIPEINTLQMNRTEAAHTGVSKLSDIAGAPLNSIPNAAENGVERTRRSFEDYLLQAFQTMNQQQVDVSNLQQQVITDPDSVDLHDVTIAMSKARMSLNLAQSVIDRLVQGWSEITTTLLPFSESGSRRNTTSTSPALSSTKRSNLSIFF